MGLKLGDVMEECQGHSLKGLYLRNLFMRVLAFWPSQTPLKLEVERGRSVEVDSERDRAVKNVEKGSALRWLKGFRNKVGCVVS